MPSWKFWDKPTEPAAAIEQPAQPARRFKVQPRTDLSSAAPADIAKTEQLARLRKHRDTVRFDVEQAELALEAENPWRERVALIDEALSATRSDRDKVNNQAVAPGIPLPAIPIENIAYSEAPAPTVAFSIDGEQFTYQEEIDWAERGFQLARSELLLNEGDPAALLPDAQPVGEADALREHLTTSLFAFATDIRDRTLAGEPLPVSPTLADLAKPDPIDGGWLDWSGNSLPRAEKENALRTLEVEEQRLLADRARELDELARWEDRLPIARRRLSEVDAQIAELVGGRP